MNFRKFSADRIFDGYSFLQNDAVLVTDEIGVVVELTNKNNAGTDVEIYNGTITPGFINCHCHLELSHLKDLVPQKTGLVNFLMSVVKNRKLVHKDKDEQIKKAAQEMYDAGIVGVADICNTADAIAVKSSGKMKWHNLVEVLNFFDENLEERLQHNIDVLEQHKILGEGNVLTPHAPYSVSAQTFAAINQLTEGKIISIHNQETEAEDQLFKIGEGDFLKLYDEFFDGRNPVEITGKSSLQTYLPHFNNRQTLLLVHNTFIKEDDILFAKEYATKHHLQIIYCLCPNANLYIEDSLPPVELLLRHHCNIVIGTDSYSSNWQLNIAEEIKTLSQHFKNVSIETFLQWATLNGAKALQWDDELGSFEKGKKPGIVLLNNDLTAKRLL